MSQFVNSLKRSWTHHLGLQLATLIVMTASFFTVAAFTSFYLNLESILSMWGKNLQMTVYLENDVDEEKVANIKSLLGSENGLSRSEFIDVETATKRFQQQMGHHVPDLFTESELLGLVPSSFELQLTEATMNAQPLAYMQGLAESLLEVEGIEDVSYGQEWVGRYSSLISVLFYVGSFLIGLLLLGGIFVSGNSIRVAIQQRRAEIEILELIGATPSMIRRPFISEGAFMGFCSAGLALLSSYLLFWLLTNAFGGYISFIGLKGYITFLPLSFAAAILLLGTLIGALGAWWSVNSLNDGWSASQGVD